MEPISGGRGSPSRSRFGTERRRPVCAADPGEDVLRVPPHGGVLVFDGYCGFCTRAVHAVLRADRNARVRALPLQGPRVLALTGLTHDGALREAWWIGADGSRRPGAAAMLAAVSAASGVPLVRLLDLPGVPRVAERVYRWVAEHRRLLRGVTPHCRARPEAACGADTGPGPAGAPR